jgi:uncharacterized protein with HEPN domain
MPSNEDRYRLVHMLEAAREAFGYTQGKIQEDLHKDRPITHAIVRCLEILGEAAANLSEDFRRDTPQIPWGDIIGMRNRLIHAYFDVNLTIVWQTATEEIPPLIQKLETLLETQS